MVTGKSKFRSGTTWRPLRQFIEHGKNPQYHHTRIQPDLINIGQLLTLQKKKTTTDLEEEKLQEEKQQEAHTPEEDTLEEDPLGQDPSEETIEELEEESTATILSYVIMIFKMLIIKYIMIIHLVRGQRIHFGY